MLKSSGGGVGVFERRDLGRLAAQLAAIGGKFILSINGTVGAREVFSPFQVEEVGTTCTLGTAGGGAKRVMELIVRSFA